MAQTVGSSAATASSPSQDAPLVGVSTVICQDLPPKLKRIGTKGPLEPFLRGLLEPSAQDYLKTTVSNIGGEVIVLKNSDVHGYYRKLIELGHTNLLTPAVAFHLSADSYSCIVFEDHLCCLSDLNNLLFVEVDGMYDMSSECRKYMFDIAETLGFLHRMRCYHGNLTLESTFLVLSSDTLVVKLGGLRGLLDCDTFSEHHRLMDLNAFGKLIEDTYAKNGKTPNPVVQSYINCLKGKRAVEFVFNHHMWQDPIFCRRLLESTNVDLTLGEVEAYKIWLESEDLSEKIKLQPRN